MADYSSFVLDDEDEKPPIPAQTIALEPQEPAPTKPDYSGFLLDEEREAPIDASRVNVQQAPPVTSAVEYRELSKSTGLPVSVIPGYEEEARSLSKAIRADLEGLSERAPRTHFMLQDASRASLLQNSVPTMASIEQSQAKLRENLRVNNMPWYEQIGHALFDTDSLELGVESGVAGAKTIAAAASAYTKVDEVRNISALRKSFDAIDAGETPDVIDPRVRAYSLSKPEDRAKMRTRLDTTQERVSKAFKDQLKNVRSYQEAAKQVQPGRVSEFTDIESAIDVVDFGKYAFGQAAIYLLGSIASGAASTGVTGSPAPGLLGFGYAVGVGDIYETLVEEGREMEDWRAGVGAVPYAAADLIGVPARAMRPVVEREALAYFKRKGIKATGDVAQKYLKEATEEEVKALQKEMVDSVFRKLAREVPRAMGEEFINEAAQEIAKDVSVKVGTDEDIVTSESLINWLNAGMAGAFGGAPVSVASEGVRHVVESRNAKVQARQEKQLKALQDAQNARLQAVQEQGTLEAWVDATRGDTLFQASPDAYVEQMAEVLTEDGAEQQVYLGVSEAETFFQGEDAPMTFEEFASAVSEVRAQLPQARALGGDLVLPASKVVAFLARDEKLSGLMGSMRLSMESSTQSDYNAQVESIMGPALEATKTQEGVQTKAETYEARFSDQLRATGYSRNYAKQYSAALRAFYETQATRLQGNDRAIAVLERRMEGLTVQRGEQGAVAAEGEFEQPGSPAFNAWFRVSKAVDEEGAPLMVYHKTKGDFDTFIPGGPGEQLSGPAMWFTTNKTRPPAMHTAGADTNEGVNVMPVYLSMQNPLIMDDDTKAWAIEVFGKGDSEFGFQLDQDAVDALKEEGYDGIIFDAGIAVLDGEVVGGREYIVFDPTQVKSAIGNRGTYDPADPSILNQEALKSLGEKPRVREDGRIELHHWSKKEGLTEINPDKFGSNNAGAEVERAHKPGWVNRTYYGLEVDAAGGYRPEKQNGNVHYTTSIEEGSLYDLIRDPDGLRAEGMDVNHYEKAIKEAGYKGYWVDAPYVGRAAAVFEPLAPEAVEVTQLNQDVRPLPGLESRSPGPNADAQAVLSDYAKSAGIKHTRASEYVKVDPARAKRIAQAYEEMEHAPNDPRVRAAYRAMIDQTLAQYRVIVEHGYTFTPMQEGMEDPYPSPSMVLADLRDNKHAYFYPTDFGFGSDASFDPADNMLMEMTDVWIDGMQLRANDVFRIVHDFYGHAPEGALFRARGEENAWQTHARLYTGDAVLAMTSETRGQNSWVNFGPHGEANRSAATMDTVFADQKMGLMPEWVAKEGLASPLEDETVLYQDAVTEITEFDDPVEVATTVTGAQANLVRFKNWKPSKTSGGKFRGVPEWVNEAAMPGRAFNKLHKLMKQLTIEGEAGRLWYEDAGDYVMNIVKGNVVDAEKFIQLLAIYSPQNTVWINTMQAVKAYNMWKSGVPASEFRVRPFGQEGALMGDEAAKRVLYENGVWGGRKTNSFYLNLMKEIISKATPAQRAEMRMDSELLAKVNSAVTVDMWVKRAMGYNTDSTTDDQGTGAYSVQEALLSRIAYELNETLEEGDKPWFPHQVQAALWTAIKARMQKESVVNEAFADSFKKGLVTKDEDGKYKVPTSAANLTLHRLNWRRIALKLPSEKVVQEVETAKLSFSDMLMRMSQDVTWEAKPSESLGFAINGMPEGAMRAYTWAARDMLLDDKGNDQLAADLGVHLSWTEVGEGGFEGDVTPNVVSTLLPTKQAGAFSREEVTLYSAAIQYVFQQDAVPWFRADAQAKPEPFKVQESNGRTVSGGGSFATWREAEAFRQESAAALIAPHQEKLDKAQEAAASKPSERNLERVAKAEAALLNAQARADGLRTRGGDMAQGVKLTFPREPTEEQLQELLDELNAWLGEGAGFTRTGNDVVVINYRSDGVPMLQPDDDVFVGTVALIADSLGAETGTFFSEGEYGYEADWTGDSSGESLLSEGPLSERPDLHERLRAWRAQATQLRQDIEARPEAFDTDAAEIEYDQSGIEGLEGFYSALRRTVEEFLPEVGMGVSLAQTVRAHEKKGSFKPAELEHAGLMAMLEEAGRTMVSKKELLDFLDLSALEFEAYETDDARYASIVLGGEDAAPFYEERLLKLEGNTYEHPHWPGHKGVLLHMRTDDRVDTEGKSVFFINELQSDMHQQGRQEGYESERAAREEELRETLDKMWDLHDAAVDLQKKAEARGDVEASKEHAREAQSHVDAIAAFRRAAELKDAVPDAPFKKTQAWVLLGLKDALQGAVSAGYDKLAWTTGSQQVVMEKLTDPKHVAGMASFYDKMLPSIANKYLKPFGIKVSTSTIMAPDMESLDPDVPVPHEVHSIEITPELRDAILEHGQPLFQGQSPQGRRGSIRFTGDSSIINVFEGNDPSTVLHELGHFFLQTQQAIHRSGAAPGEWNADHRALLKWLGSEDGSFTTEQHEKFARTFEQYLRTGNAPSTRLRRVFQNFKRWLMSVYKSAKQLNADLDPQVTEIMDRMLATDEEISELEADPTFASDKNFLQYLTAAERKSYILRLTRQSESAREKLLAKALKDVTRNATQEWKELREKALREVDESIAQRPVYQAIHFMQTGKLLNREWPEGMEVERVQINRGLAEQMFGEEALKGLPSGVLTKKGGAHPDAIAEQFGFRSGADLIIAMQTATPRRELREQEADDLMVKRHGDMLHDGTLEAQAKEAMESQDRTALLVYEAQVLARKTGKPSASREALAQRAQELLADIPLGEVLKNISGYYRAEVKAAAQAGKHLAKGNFEKAAEAKQQQILNHMMFREATAAKEKVTKELKRFRKLRKPQVKGKVRIEEEYHEKIVQVLDAFNLGSKLTDKTRAKLTKQAFIDWALKKETDDLAVFITPEKILESNKQHWRELTWEEFLELSDVIENLEAQGRRLRTITVDGQKVELQDVAEDLSASVLTHGSTRKWTPQPRETGPSIARGIGQYFLMHTRARTLIKKLDGWESFKSAYKYLLRDIDAASVKHEARIKQVGTEISEIFDRHYGTGLRALVPLKQKIAVEELGTSLTREGLIAVALNMGNSDNMNKLVGGYEKRGWTHNKVREAVEAHLTEKDLALVNDIWAYVDSFWPEVAALEKSTTGVTPDKVPAEAFELTLADGTVVQMTGGYYPLVADPMQSGSAVDQEAQSMADLMRTGRFATAQTSRGHTKARVEHKGQPVRLDLQVLFSHVQQVVTDLTMREAIENAYKVLKHNDVRESIEDTAGVDTHRYLRWWLEDLAKNNISAGEALTKGLDSLRAGVSVAVMGFKYTTVAVQLTGLAQSITVVDPVHMAKGLWRYASNVARDPRRLVMGQQYVLDKSKIMKDRSTTFHRDVNDALRAMQRRGQIRGNIAKAGFWPIVKMQMQVDTITWLGAYEKAHTLFSADFGEDTEGLEARAVEYADNVIIETQGSGLMKDLAAVERGSVSETHRLMSLVRLFTVFQSYFITKFNLAYERAAMKDLRKPGDVAKLATEYAMLFIVEAVIAEAILDRMPDFEDDDESVPWWLAKLTMSNISAMLVGVREVAGGMSGFSAAPAGLRGLDSIGKALSQSYKAADAAIEGEDINTYGLAKSVISATGIIAKVPVEWLNQVIRGMEQEEDYGNATFLDYLRYNQDPSK